MIKEILPYYKWAPDTRWDNKVLNYDKTVYNWSEWFFESIRELKPTLTSMQEIHLYFTTAELVTLRKHLERLTNSKEFSQRLDTFFAENIAHLIDSKDYLIQSTSGIRVVIPDQDKVGRLLSFHTGYWTGYNNFMGTVWIPLTKACDSNTMQVLSWEDSVELMKKIHLETLPLKEIECLCKERMYPVNLEVGQAWLFNQGHLHGNINNETVVTRVSFDARWALPGHDLGPRRAGSFYRMQGHHAEIRKEDLKPGPWVVFVDQNSEFIGQTPHYMIREFLLGVAARHNITINEWSNEYWGCTWMPKLLDFVSKTTISGLIFPSVHAFSGSVPQRLAMFTTAINNGQQLMFVDENIVVQTVKDIDIVKKIYDITC
jgi:sporadic carbohydrate cluster 2OG-Fe(II) oxygenase